MIGGRIRKWYGGMWIPSRCKWREKTGLSLDEAGSYAQPRWLEEFRLENHILLQAVLATKVCAVSDFLQTCTLGAARVKPGAQREWWHSLHVEETSRAHRFGGSAHQGLSFRPDEEGVRRGAGRRTGICGAHPGKAKEVAAFPGCLKGPESLTCPIPEIPVCEHIFIHSAHSFNISYDPWMVLEMQRYQKQKEKSFISCLMFTVWWCWKRDMKTNDDCHSLGC